MAQEWLKILKNFGFEIYFLKLKLITMKKYVFIIVFLKVFTFSCLYAGENPNRSELDKLYKQGLISKDEYINILKPEKKLKILNKNKKSFNINKKNKNKLTELLKKDNKPDYIFTNKELKELGKPKKLEYNSYPPGMQKLFKKVKNSFYNQSKKAGQDLYKTFTRSPTYGQKYPGKLIKAMALYEVFYLQKLRETEKAITRYKRNWSKETDIIYKLKDQKDIGSLIGMNKGRKNMRNALGITMEETPEQAIQKFWILGEFLDLGKPQQLEKHNNEIKKRKKLINDYKVEIAALKKTLEEEEKLKSKEITNE